MRLRHFLVFLFLLLLTASAPAEKTLQEQRVTQPGPKPSSLPSPCVGVEQSRLSCDAIQARNSDSQVVIGWIQAFGLIASLAFSAIAVRAAVRAAQQAAIGARASIETLEETKRMNAAAVRPHVNVEEAWINFDNQPPKPAIKLVVRNASQYTAYGWEWQGHIRFRLPDVEQERVVPLTPWLKRGARGVDIPPPDPQHMIPHVVGPALSQAEMAAISALHFQEGLTVFLKVFSRAFDIFGNEVEDVQDFVCTAYNALAVGGSNYQMKRVPPGTQVQGQEITVPRPPAR